MDRKPATLLSKVMSAYGHLDEYRDPGMFVREWPYPPMTQEEAITAIRKLRRAKRRGVWHWKVVNKWTWVDVIRNMVLVSRGVDLRKVFSSDELLLWLKLPMEQCQMYDEWLPGKRNNRYVRGKRDITGDIIRLVLEFD